MKKINLYYSLYENYPAYRVDLSELVAKSLAQLGLKTTWFMASKDPISSCRVVDYLGQHCYLPLKLQGNSFVSKLINKLVYWSYDIYRLIRAATEDYEILQVRDKYIASLAGIVVAKVSGKKFVYWCSYPFPEHYLELAKLSKGLKRAYYFLHGVMAKYLLYKVIMPLSDHVFVQSEQMLMDIADYGLLQTKMTAISMGVPHRLLEWSQKQSLPVVQNQIVYIGIMTPERRLDMIVDAFAIVKVRCPQATLLMVGDGVYPSERQALEEQVKRLGLTEAVRFTGFVPLEQAWQYAASSAVCLSPFYPTPVLRSCSPTKLVEYLALGRPVVCNHQPEQTSIIQETSAGLCVDWDANEFAKACIWMLEHPEQAEKMAKRGPAWVSEHRVYSKLADVVWTQYQRILGGDKA